MLSNKALSLAALVAAAATTLASAFPLAMTSSSPPLRARQSCVEGKERVCYGVSGGQATRA
ncbi:hypothetical protein GGTG_01287 [Gaeumannomyces tritici R3-111a-1]|uniref:Uncharacterized protein n=1 Tax=Gaeumannomyces tritici (strain R3-111a-1) TaxID=644352 RepID=J3NJ54_GAET3|nr:hypothetical protein GGTG_01287 [Gaeumannomyces tritici R3-111a-1]EJT81304.1 hypothetical protein GGTG_01287 [Gaeumannomyces tritici R3-111a-1]